MASIMELLEALNTEEAAVSTSDLAGKLKASKEGTLKQLTREKDKGHVDGNSQEGWLITEAGRKALEKGEIHPSMIDEGVTPRQQFEAMGRRIGIKEDRIVLATDIVWSGDYNDVKWVWEALGQANIADDLRSVWVNSWRAKLHKAIPPELETELTGVGKAGAEAGEDLALRKPGGREYIIVDDEPVRVGANLGDYNLQDAKDILAIRALRNRFEGAGQQGAAAQSGTAEKVSDILTALSPYLNKESKSDIETLKEVIADKLALQRQEILSQIPHSGQLAQPKTFMEQITEFVAAMGSLKEAGPMLRSILGVPESSGNISAGVPVQVRGPDGKPLVMDLGQVINWKKFEGEERRADERQQALTGLGQTVRENIGDGIAAIKAAVEEAKSTGAKTPPGSQPTTYECSDCHTQFAIPDVPYETVKCPNPQCGRVYTKEEVMGA
ncbi:hypothetical protein ES707_19560 [subsurface metagenome]